MQTKNIGNLFELAERQLQNEKLNEKRKNYSMLDVIDYAVIIRKQLDRYGKKGNIIKVKNIKTKKIVKLERDTEVRRRKYLKERWKK